MESILGKTIAWTFPNLEGLLWVWVQWMWHPLLPLSASVLLFFIWKQNFDTDHKAGSICNFIFEELLPLYMSREHFTMRYVLIWAFFLIAGQLPPKATSKYEYSPPSHSGCETTPSGKIEHVLKLTGVKWADLIEIITGKWGWVYLMTSCRQLSTRFLQLASHKILPWLLEK